ncbi:hypothetical protein D3C81_784920 [compost metagenome]
MLHHVGLQVYVRFVRIDAGGDVQRSHRFGLLRQCGRLLRNGDRVQIHDHKVAGVIVLQRNEIFDGPDVIA